MSSLIRGIGSWLRPLRPFAQPAAVFQCLNLVRGFANQRHKKIIKLAKGMSSQCFQTSFSSVNTLSSWPLTWLSKYLTSIASCSVSLVSSGFRGRANRCFTVAFHRVQKARQYSYRDRKVRPECIIITSFGCFKRTSKTIICLLISLPFKYYHSTVFRLRKEIID